MEDSGIRLKVEIRFGTLRVWDRIYRWRGERGGETKALKHSAAVSLDRNEFLLAPCSEGRRTTLRVMKINHQSDVDEGCWWI